MANQITQERCPKDDTLMALWEIKVIRDMSMPIHPTPFVTGVWVCPKCHDRHDITIPYLEMLGVTT